MMTTTAPMPSPTLTMMMMQAAGRLAHLHIFSDGVLFKQVQLTAGPQRHLKGPPTGPLHADDLQGGGHEESVLVMSISTASETHIEWGQVTCK